MALASFEGFLFSLRWFHFLSGVVWIGLLYYFNFIQGSFFAETDANTKSACTQKLVPRALWWFRWSAMVTFLTGFIIYSLEAPRSGMNTAWGLLITIGVILGTLMWLNVWFIIWPNQKVVIKSAVQAASGGQAIPDAAARAGRALVASRTNVMFSIPMLFFMGAARHLPMQKFDISLFPTLWVVLAIVGLLELNAIKGKTGPLTTIKGVISSGFALAALLYLVVEFVA